MNNKLVTSVSKETLGKKKILCWLLRFPTEKDE